MINKKLNAAYGIKSPPQSPSPVDIEDTLVPSESDSHSAEQEFIWARFRRNQDFMKKNSDFKTLLDKKDDWSEADLEKFKGLITQLKL